MDRLWHRVMMPASSIHCRLPAYFAEVEPFFTTEYWNFLFSLASWRGMDWKHSLMRDLSFFSAYFTMSSS